MKSTRYRVDELGLTLNADNPIADFENAAGGTVRNHQIDYRFIGPLAQ